MLYNAIFIVALSGDGGSCERGRTGLYTSTTPYNSLHLGCVSCHSRTTRSHTSLVSHALRFCIAPPCPGSTPWPYAGIRGQGLVALRRLNDELALTSEKHDFQTFGSCACCATALRYGLSCYTSTDAPLVVPRGLSLARPVCDTVRILSPCRSSLGLQDKRPDQPNHATWTLCFCLCARVCAYVRTLNTILSGLVVFLLSASHIRSPRIDRLMRSRVRGIGYCSGTF